MMIQRILKLSLVCFALWLLLSGKDKPLLLFLGIVSALLSAYLVERMKIIEPYRYFARFLRNLFRYLPWLSLEIIKSNLHMTRHIWNPVLRITPNVFTTPSSQKTDLGMVTYANSITLTPGTISIDTPDGDIEVHAISHEAREGVQSGEMDRRVLLLEKGFKC